MTTEPQVANEESKTSVLMFDHMNLMSSPMTNKQTDLLSEVRLFHGNHAHSPSQSWKQFFLDSESRMKESNIAHTKLHAAHPED